MQTEPEPKFNCLNLLKTLTLEPFLFVFMASIFMKETVVTQLILDKLCLNEYNFTLEECEAFNETNSYKIEMEQVSNNYKTYSSVLEFTPGALIAMMLGQWSDRYGRKLALYITIIGKTLEYAILLINAYLWELPITYLLICSVPSGLTGGMICVLAACFSMGSEMSTREKRALKYALLELGFGLGMPAGMVIGGQLIKLGYVYVFIFGCSMLVAAFLWSVFVIKETVVSEKASFAKKFKDLFNFNNIKEGFKTCIKKRENKGRLKILLLMLSTCIYVLGYVTLASVSYIFAHHVYGWNVTKYNTINAIFTFAKIFASVIAVVILVKRFKIREPILGIIGTISIVAGTVVKGFAFESWVFIIGMSTDMFGGLGGLAIRSAISKLVHKDELGQVFALTAAFESLIPIIGVLIFTQVMNASLSFYPQLPFIVIAVITLVPLLIFIWFLTQKNVYEKMEKDSGDEMPGVEIKENRII